MTEIAVPKETKETLARLGFPAFMLPMALMALMDYLDGMANHRGPDSAETAAGTIPTTLPASSARRRKKATKWAIKSLPLLN